MSKYVSALDRLMWLKGYLWGAVTSAIVFNLGWVLIVYMHG